MRYDMGVGCGLVIPLSRSLVRKVRGCDIDYILARLSTFASTATVESRANPTTFTPPLVSDPRSHHGKQYRILRKGKVVIGA